MLVARIFTDPVDFGKGGKKHGWGDIKGFVVCERFFHGGGHGFHEYFLVAFDIKPELFEVRGQSHVRQKLEA